MSGEFMTIIKRLASSLQRYKYYALLVAIAIIVYSAIIAFYENERRNVFYANHELMLRHSQEVYTLNQEMRQEIEWRDKRYLAMGYTNASLID